MFFALPGLCGDFRDLIGTGKWGMAARGQVKVVYNIGFGSGLFALRSALVLDGDAQLLISLGGKDQPVCASATDPSGMFMKIRVNSGVSVTGFTLLNLLLSILSPSVSVSVDAYLMVRQDTRLLPPFIKAEFSESVELTIRLLLNLVAWFKDTVTKSTSQVISELSDINNNVSAFFANCAGSPSCWLSSPELSGASSAVGSLMTTLKSLPSSVSMFFSKVDELIAAAQAIVTQLQSNIQTAVGVSACK